jgi:uncharacterized protein (TIGR03085 family)
VPTAPNADPTVEVTMAADNYALTERVAICDLLTGLGPDQPTLCQGWSTRDLAAHLVMRERRPLAAAGLVIPPLSRHTERVRQAYAARPFAELVALLHRPPRWSLTRLPALDRAVNTLEMFLHLEDIRRGQPHWQPRELPPGLARALWARISTLARLRLRRWPASVVIEASGHDAYRTGAGGEEVRLTGDPGELTIFLSGRQRAARVELTGPAGLTDRLARARLGF